MIFILSAIFPYYSETNLFPPSPDPLFTNTKTYEGYIELLYGGWIGIVLIAVSVLLFNPERKKKALIIGILGCVLIGFNLIFRTSIQTSTMYQTITSQSGLYIGFTFWIALCAVTGYVVMEEEGLDFLRAVMF